MDDANLQSRDELADRVERLEAELEKLKATLAQTFGLTYTNLRPEKYAVFKPGKMYASPKEAA